MNPMIKMWLNDLYTTAIEESKTAISNERIWANGGDDAEFHCGNIDTLEEYIEVLTQLKEEIN
jgi:hypothetical protein